MTEGARAFREPPPHGSMAEEAAKLAEVVHLWLRDRSDAARAAAAPDAGTAGEPAPECRSCPICRARRAFSGMDPEVLAHLSAAAASLGAAVKAMSKGQGSGRA